MNTKKSGILPKYSNKFLHFTGFAFWIRFLTESESDLSNLYANGRRLLAIEFVETIVLMGTSVISLAIEINYVNKNNIIMLE